MINKKDHILRLVEEYISEKHSLKEWVAGKDWVQYSGPYYSSNEYRSAINTLLNEWMVLGHESQKFEKEFAPFLGKSCGVITNSGSSANLLMVSTLLSEIYDLPKGSNIIVPVAGFPTTVNPIIQAGSTPIFVDIELDTLNIDLDKLEKYLSHESSREAKALMFAHVLGNPPNMDRVMEIVKKYNLLLLEDCCDALGSTYKGKLLGSFGEMSTCSFYPAHHICTGEGGFVACKNPLQERIVRSLRDWGRQCYCVGKKASTSKQGTCGCRFSNWLEAFPDEIFDHKYQYGSIGYNLKPLELQCSVGLQQIKKLPEIHEKRIHNYNRLYSLFSKYEEFFVLPKATENAEVSWFAFPLTIKDGSPFKRNDMCGFLEDNKIQTRTFFGGCLLFQPMYKNFVKNIGYDKIKEMYPIATKATTDTFFLGVSPVITDQQLDYVGEKVNEFMKNYGTH